MIFAPFEVVPVAGGFTWRLIGACGRTLVYTDDVYPTDFHAAEAAKAARSQYRETAMLVDAA